MTSISSDDQPSILWAARTGPYHNPYEGHSYFNSLPFCHFIGEEDYATTSRKRPSPSLGELMGGCAWEPFALLPTMSSMASALDGVGHQTSFLQNCTTSPFTKEQARQLSHAVEQRWFYQLYLDDLPVWGMLGESIIMPDVSKATEDSANAEKLLPRIFTKFNLRVTLDDRGELVQVDLSSEYKSLKLFKAGIPYNLQLGIEYLRVVSSTNKGKKFDRYVDHEFFTNEVRKNSTINSLVQATVLIFMAGMAVYKLWKHNSVTEDASNSGGDVEKGTAPLLSTNTTSRKLDPEAVFTPPPRVGLLAVLLGNGCHLLAWVFVIAIYSKDINPLEYGPGGRLGLMIYGYAATSIVAGYTSAYYLQQQQSRVGVESGNECWKITMVMTVLLVPLMTAIVATITAIASVPVHTINTISAQGTLWLLVLWLGLVVPSNIVGTYLGRWHQAKCGNPINSFFALSIPPPKTNPRTKWVNKKIMMNVWFCAAIGGLLPFAVLFVELFYAMTSMWNNKIYLIGWLNLCVLVLLVTVISASSAVMTLVLLQTQDTPRSWQWNAFIFSASTGGYVFCYSIYYFTHKLQMEGLFSIIHYFGAMLLLSMGVALVCGAVAHFAAYRIVRLLYSNIKAA